MNVVGPFDLHVRASRLGGLTHELMFEPRAVGAITYGWCSWIGSGLQENLVLLPLNLN